MLSSHRGSGQVHELGSAATAFGLPIPLVENSLGAVTLYQMNEFGQVISIMDALGGPTNYEYEHASGQKTKEVDPMGAATTYDYDSAGNLTKTVGPDGAALAIEHGELNLPLRAVDAIGGEWRWGYDNNGRLIGRIDPLDRRTQFEWRGDQVIAVTDAAGHATRFTYDESGNLASLTASNGATSHWHYDAFGRPSTTIDPRGNLRRRQRDALGRLKRVDEPDGNVRELSYDGESNIIRSVDNLTAAAYADGKVDLRMPDAVGNLFRTADRSDRKYGPAGQLLEAHDARGVTTYEYDAEGNLTKKTEPDGSVWVYEWNGAGMLARVVRPNGHAVEFEYDPLARRTAKKYRGKTTRWIWDGNLPLHEWVERDANVVDEDFARAPREVDAVIADEKALRALLARRPSQGPPRDAVFVKSLEATSSVGTREEPATWLFEPESFAPLAKLVNGQRFGIVTDHLGTPKAMFDDAGRKVWGADVDGDGDLRGLRGERGACPFRWPGQYEDVETGLYYNRFRYYDPQAGRYCCQDPIRLRASLAFYAYPNDPLTWVDPMGLAACGGTAAERLPPMKGMSVSEAEETLAAEGFTRTNPANLRNQTWSHSDGSEVRIHAFGNKSATNRAGNLTPKSGLNAHIHKETPGGAQLTDRGIPSTNLDETHIGIKNPSDLPTVTGRSHGYGT